MSLVSSSGLYVWRHRGALLELQNAAGEWVTPALPEAQVPAFREKVMRWSGLAVKEEERTGVPAAWILGTIYAESNGNPSVVSYDHGYGLMQITSNALKQGLSNEEVLVPANNVRLGADFMASLIKRYGEDLPKISAAFNAGSVMSSHCKTCVGNNPCLWGLCESKDHGIRTVMASNTALALLEGLPPADDNSSPAPGKNGVGLVVTLALGALAGIYAGVHGLPKLFR